MASTAPPVDDTGHPVPCSVRALASTVAEIADRSHVTLEPAATRETLRELARLRSRVDALTLSVAAHAERVEVGADSGSTSTGVWWAVATQQNRATACGLVKLAAALEDRWTRVARGCAAGEVSLDQARVIAHALEALPDDLEPGLLAQAEALLVGYAAIHDPATLRILGRAVLETLAPDLAEAHEQKKIEAEEARARATTRLSMSNDGHGRVFGRFTIPEAQAGMLKKALWAFASPRHRSAVSEHGPAAETESAVLRPTPERLGLAFCTLIESLPADTLPRAGGRDATCAVITELCTLTESLGTAHLDTGEPLSAGQTRRLACNAGIIPVVMNGPSQVLDVGRGGRLHTEPMRTAVVVRDRECTAEGCDWPPGMCEVHHDHAWSDGGVTNVENARLLCPHHHHRIHDPAYSHQIVGDNQVRFHRRT